MKLNRTLIALTTLALAASTAQAQTVPASGTAGAGSYSISDTSASVSQTITVTVPKRFGLHLHLSSWNLNLGNVGVDGTYSSATGNNGSTPQTSPATNPADANCVRAGDHSSGATGTGRDFLYYTAPATGTSSKDDKIKSLLNGSTFEGDQYADTAGNAYSYEGNLTWATPSNLRSPATTTLDAPIGGYPGFYISGSNLVWKGPIMCSFQTIVQKFSNSKDGFFFSANLTTSTSFPFPLYIRDFIKGTSPAGVSTNSAALTTTSGPAILAQGTTGTTTGGWLDDHLLQVIVFDGSETNGSYKGNVTYTLSDVTPISSP